MFAPGRLGKRGVGHAREAIGTLIETTGTRAVLAWNLETSASARAMSKRDPNTGRVRLFARLWQEMQDLPRHLGQHSGGMVICQGSLDTVVPLMERDRFRFEIVFVNDGSRDDTLTRLLDRGQGDRRLRIVNLSRNFGKELALAAGLQAARGDAGGRVRRAPRRQAASLARWTQARPANSFVSVCTFTRSPSLMNSGTRIFSPRAKTI